MKNWQKLGKWFIINFGFLEIICWYKVDIQLKNISIRKTQIKHVCFAPTFLIRQACLSHHQIVIWICFWFSICQTQQKYQQKARRQCCLLLLPSVPVFQWVVTFLSCCHKQSNALLLHLPHLTPYHPSPHIPPPSFAMWRIFLPSTSSPSARITWPWIRVRNIYVTIWESLWRGP